MKGYWISSLVSAGRIPRSHWPRAGRAGPDRAGQVVIETVFFANYFMLFPFHDGQSRFKRTIRMYILQEEKEKKQHKWPTLRVNLIFSAYIYFCEKKTILESFGVFIHWIWIWSEWLSHRGPRRLNGQSNWISFSSQNISTSSKVWEELLIYVCTRPLLPWQPTGLKK